MSEARPIPTTTPTKRLQRQATGTDTVTVACNLPNGHVLQIYDVEETESILPNGRSIKENMSTPNWAAGQWVLNGCKLDMAALTAGELPDYRVIKGATPDCGYALTTGVPRDFWEEWLRQNKSSPLVTGRHVYSASSEPRAAAEAKEYKDLRSGLQGLNPSGDYRVPNGGRAIRKYDPNDNGGGRVNPSQGAIEDEE